MGDAVRKAELYDRLARVGHALGSGRRLELLDLLAQGPRTVADLAAAAELRLTTASAHLQTLKGAGLVTTRRSGTSISYFLADDDVAALYLSLRTVAVTHLPDVGHARAAYLGGADFGGADTERADTERVDTEQIDRAELLRRASAGEVVVLDVRPAVEFAAGHIPGAVSIPIDELPARLAELPAELEVVVYCRGAWCVFAHDAVRLLTARGLRAVRLTDGMLEWRLARFPVAA
jgi:rhodanese-related sulfurtransferase/DNA-binding transcriptional ArsR family regulator